MRYLSRTHLVAALIACLAGLPPGAFSDAASAVTLRHPAMGTEFVFTVYARGDDVSTDAVAQFAREAFDAIDDLEARISSWIPDSQTSYLNNHAADGPVRVSVDLFGLVDTAKEMHARTGGAFDCSVGPLLALYGFRNASVAQPDAARLAEARAKVGMERVRLDSNAGTIAFDIAGMRLDFGGIGKGLALDLAADFLKDRGVERALLHGGTSTVVGIGSPPGESGWTVHIRHPYNADRPLTTVLIRDESLSTSGCYGAPDAVCDILDPRSGLPVIATLSATAIAPTATETDALSTAFLVMGAEEVGRFCARNSGVRALVAPTTDSEEPSVLRFGMNK